MRTYTVYMLLVAQLSYNNVLKSQYNVAVYFSSNCAVSQILIMTQYSIYCSLYGALGVLELYCFYTLHSCNLSVYRRPNLTTENLFV